MPNVVAYYRVSTQKQRASGLGIDAQKASVAAYVATTDATLVASYTEAESARKDSLDNRPQLRAALAHAKRSKATLVIAKIDRLARSVLVTSQLLAAGVEFVACDNPHANRMTIQILAVMAEYESRQIAERTKAALAQRRARGGALGAENPRCRNLTREGVLRGARASAAASHAATLDAYADIVATMFRLRAGGLADAAIAAALNADGQTTRDGAPWTRRLVARRLRRAERDAATIVAPLAA